MFDSGCLPKNQRERNYQNIKHHSEQKTTTTTKPQREPAAGRQSKSVPQPDVVEPVAFRLMRGGYFRYKL